jgi:hypothetical protein
MRLTYLIFVAGLTTFAGTLSAGILLLPDQADYVYTSDTTVTGDFFNRPVGNGTSAPDTLSDFADAVDYDTLSFALTTTGVYDLTVTPVDLSFNSYLFLYQTSFDPANPLVNVLLGESNADGSSNLTATLSSDTTYILVATGFANFDGGPYSGEIKEVEDAAAASEPLSGGLMAGGILLLVSIRMRTSRIV